MHLVTSSVTDCLRYYVSYNIIILHLDKYFDCLAQKIIASYIEWKLLKENNKINPNSKLFTFFADSEIKKMLSTIREIFYKNNLKIYIVYSKTENLHATPVPFEGWISDFDKFKKKIVNLIKKNSKYFIITDFNLNFDNFVVKNGIKYGIPSGLEIEFLQTLRSK